MAGIADSVPQTGSQEVKNVAIARCTRRCQLSRKTRIKLQSMELAPKIAIGAAGVMHITQAEGQCQMRKDLPRISDIRLNTVVRSESASRQDQKPVFPRKTPVRSP